jgi:subtilisin family serine protease
MEPLKIHVGHGTLVSRLITSLIPSSEFVFVKVDRNGIAYESDLINALDICNDYQVDIVSLSLGSGSYDGFCTGHPVTDKISELKENNVLVVAASGNDGYGSVRMPACSPDVLSVVRVDSNGELVSGSSFVSGLSVIGALGEYDSYSGTSFSAPAVSAGVSVYYLKE